MREKTEIGQTKKRKVGNNRKTMWKNKKTKKKKRCRENVQGRQEGKGAEGKREMPIKRKREKFVREGMRDRVVRESNVETKWKTDVQRETDVEEKKKIIKS